MLVVILVTPAQINLNSYHFAPSIPSFLFDIVLDKNYSFKSLRPIFLSLPISLFFYWLFVFTKRKFF